MALSHKRAYNVSNAPSGACLCDNYKKPAGAFYFAMNFHDAANLFPLMDTAELDELASDIKANGLMEPIWLHPDGSILDGRNRYRACQIAGVEPAYNTWQGEGSPVAFVLSLNLHRRHLTASQRAAIGAEVLPGLEAEAKERQAHGLTAPGVTLVAKTPQATSGKPAPKARDIAAKLVGVGARSIQDAKKIKEEAPELFQQVASGTITLRDAKKKVTRREAIETISTAANAAPAPVAELKQQYNVIYADPPWRYEHVKTSSRAIENQYPTMALNEICDLPIADIAYSDAILFMWATSPKLHEALQVVTAWGFVYRTNMIWDKEIIGMGYYARQQHELLLICTRGSIPTPEPANRPASVYREKRPAKHSQKPQWFYEMIENMYPLLPRIELFARATRAGWDCWGNEV